MNNVFNKGQQVGSALVGMIGNANAQIAASLSVTPESIPVYHRQVERNAVEDELWQRYQSAHANGAKDGEILRITMEMMRSPNVRLNVKVLTIREIFNANPTLENATAIIEHLGDAADAEYVEAPRPKLTIVQRWQSVAKSQ